ncbi:unnamed protein product [Triticum turgidum subsp. durum]|uniref:Uncharacterized protein n=1 Tax=Triticum turgidum subsp. durum TaxID=4567 RepID=A0A9R0Y1Z5_TRITD|nr:unnamed protein product [Triticum turgidum subsp. durum]
MGSWRVDSSDTHVVVGVVVHNTVVELAACGTRVLGDGGRTWRNPQRDLGVLGDSEDGGKEQDLAETPKALLVGLVTEVNREVENFLWREAAVETREGGLGQELVRQHERQEKRRGGAAGDGGGAICSSFGSPVAGSYLPYAKRGRGGGRALCGRDEGGDAVVRWQEEAVQWGDGDGRRRWARWPERRHDDRGRGCRQRCWRNTARGAGAMAGGDVAPVVEAKRRERP